LGNHILLKKYGVYEFLIPHISILIYFFFPRLDWGIRNSKTPYFYFNIVVVVDSVVFVDDVIIMSISRPIRTEYLFSQIYSLRILCQFLYQSFFLIVVVVDIYWKKFTFLFMSISRPIRTEYYFSDLFTQNFMSISRPITATHFTPNKKTKKIKSSTLSSPQIKLLRSFFMVKNRI